MHAELIRPPSIASAMLNVWGLSVRSAVNDLVERGLEQEQAEAIVARITDYSPPDEVPPPLNLEVIFGVLFIIGGIGLTYASYMHSILTGGTSYVVANGAILSGVVMLYRGLAKETA